MTIGVLRWRAITLKGVVGERRAMLVQPLFGNQITTPETPGDHQIRCPQGRVGSRSFCG